jgi:hypothetical protein
LASGALTVQEDSRRTNFLAFGGSVVKGPANESSQVVRYALTNDNPGLFLMPPTMSMAGTLSFQPRANACGQAQVTVMLYDSGGTAFGGLNAAGPQTFTVTVANVNDAPVLKALDLNFATRSIREDGATVYHLGVNDLETPSGSLVVTVSSTNTALVDASGVQEVISGTNRTFTITPQANVYGATLLTFRVSDGTNSASKSALLRVTPVNDAPSLTLAANEITWGANQGRYSAPLVASVNQGPWGESTQGMTYRVVNAIPSLFLVPPVLSPAGVLSFTPRPGLGSGAARLDIFAADSGGISGGGSNRFTTNIVINITQ